MERTEAKLQKEFTNYLVVRGWWVKATHGNLYQSGFPDLFACHKKYGHRWIEMKVMPGGRFTQAQLDTFPHISANGSGVWVIVAATAAEYDKLFKKCNWAFYTSLWRG